MEVANSTPFATQFTAPASCLSKFDRNCAVAQVTPISTTEVNGDPVVVCWGCHPGGIFAHDQFLSQHMFKGVLRVKGDMTSALQAHFRNNHKVEGKPLDKHLVFNATPHAAAWQEAAEKVADRVYSDRALLQQLSGKRRTAEHQCPGPPAKKQFMSAFEMLGVNQA